MSRIINILDGNANLLLKKVGLPNEEVELLATLREGICTKQCAFNQGKTYLTEEKKCAACGCHMDVKWRAIEAKCILGAW